MPEHSPIKVEKAEEREPATAFSVPALPKHFVARAALAEEVVAWFLRQGRRGWRDARRMVLRTDLGRQKVGGRTRSAGGFGKTTLAMALCVDVRIREHFPDGIRWLTLGPQPDLLQLVNGLARTFDAEFPLCSDINLAVNQLQAVLEGKQVLLVLDDLWQKTHAVPFLFDTTAYLVTTCWPDLADDLITPRWPDFLIACERKSVTVDQMSVDEATALLSQWLGEPAADQQPLRELATYLGLWALLLELVAGQLRQLVVQNQKSAPQAVAEVRKQLVARGFTSFDYWDDQARLSALERALSVSLHQLQALGEPSLNWRERYLELAIFPETMEIPCATIFKLWQETAGFEQHDSQKALVAMRDLSLLTHYDVERQTVRLHEAVRAYLGQQVDNLAPLHSALLAAHLPASGKWAELPSDEPYMCHHLASHLCAAGHSERLGELLLEFDWLQAKLEASDINGLMADYEVYLGNCAPTSSEAAEESDIELLQRALSRAAHLLAQDKSQLVGQLWGRLANHSSPALQRLLSQAALSPGTLRLRPLTPSSQAHPALIRTLRGHTDTVTRLAVTPDGQQIISLSRDETQKVWDLASGDLLDTFRGYSSETFFVQINGKLREVSYSSYDKTLKVLDLTEAHCLHTLTGHTGSVIDVAVSPDGQWLISASDDHTIKVWHLTSNHSLHTLTGHTGSVLAMVVTPDGLRLISASNDETLKIWHLPTGQCLRTLTGHTNRIVGLALTPDGQRIISASHDCTLKIWHLATGECLHTLTGHTNWVKRVLPLPDGQRIISTSDDDTIKVWHLDSGQCLHTFTAETGWVDAVTFTPDGQRIILATDDETLDVWDLTSGVKLDTLIGHTDWVTAVIAVGERIISGSDDGTIKVWDLAGVGQIDRRTGHTKEITALLCVPDGLRIISASEDKTLKVWDLASRQLLRTFTGHTGTVNGVAVTGDGQRIISVSDDKTLKVWELASGQLLKTLTGHTGLVYRLLLSPDGQRIISASEDKTLKVWDLASGQLLKTLTGHTDFIHQIAVTPDGQRIISASKDKTLKVWRLSSGECLCTLTGHTECVHDVVITPDGQHIISASEDKTLKVWHLASGHLLNTLTGHTEAVYEVATVGQRIISASLRELKVWHLASGDLLNTLTGHTDSISEIAVIGQLIISTSWDRVLKVWELATGKCLTTLYLNEPISTLIVAPDGQTVVAGGEVGGVHILRLEGGRYGHSG